MLEDFFEIKILKRFGIATKIKENKTLEEEMQKKITLIVDKIKKLPIYI